MPSGLNLKGFSLLTELLCSEHTYGMPDTLMLVNTLIPKFLYYIKLSANINTIIIEIY